MNIFDDIANASHHLGEVIADLDQIRLDPATPGAERTRIMLVLPRLRTRRRELDAEFDALVARAQAMPPPPDAIVASIHEATVALARRVTSAAEATVALTLALAVVTEARRLV